MKNDIFFEERDTTNKNGNMFTKDEIKELQFLGLPINTGKKLTMTPDRQSVLNKLLRYIVSEKQ
ncbi:hypothetical protein [Bacillus siamensis]|uniref:hypothetical protein n=1 Tax=Bacillus siamensis TaxID=659243 RepID=UPI002E1DF53D|nr:hypothetical protein [Bacillus siamensis]